MTACAWGQAPAAAPGGTGRNHDSDVLERQMHALKLRLALQDVAEVDEVDYTSTPAAKNRNPTGPGAGNPVIVHAHTFVPKKLDRKGKHPLIVYAHGGVHANVTSGVSHIFRELLEQGYSIIAPDYRGSTGYGRAFYELIDYGGRENDDVWSGRAWMLETYSFLDPQRVGMIGWSHGGMITLFNVFDHPEGYAAAYAGVPVSDLVARLGYATDSYRALFSAQYHIGKTVRDDIMEYRRRSPIFHVRKLRTPLLVHTNTNDDDVNVLEVERLISELKAEGKQFESKIYQNAPGGHSFNRLDTQLARASRREIYKFLAGHLKPAFPLP